MNYLNCFHETTNYRINDKRCLTYVLKHVTVIFNLKYQTSNEFSSKSTCLDLIYVLDHYLMGTTYMNNYSSKEVKQGCKGNHQLLDRVH